MNILIYSTPIFWTHEKGAFLVLGRVFLFPLMTTSLWAGYLLNTTWAPEEPCQNTNTQSSFVPVFLMVSVVRKAAHEGPLRAPCQLKNP